MGYIAAITALEEEWNIDKGFFGLLRRGVYDGEGAVRVIRILESVVEEDDGLNAEKTTLSKRFVSLTWIIPMFMSWQRERIAEVSGELAAFDAVANVIEGLLTERILGAP